MEPQSGIIFCQKPAGHPATRPPGHPTTSMFYQKEGSVPNNLSVSTYYVCPHLLCLSPPIMSVPTFYVCPRSPPIMSVTTHPNHMDFSCGIYSTLSLVPTYYVCPHLSCLSPPTMSVPTSYVCSHLLFCVSLSLDIIFLLTCPS